jgi:ribosomal protein L31
MSNTFLNLYENESQKSIEYAGIIGSYQGLINIVIDYLQNDYPFYTKETLIEKLKENHEKLQNRFKKTIE